MNDTVNYRGFEISIETDETPMHPRTEFDNFGTMVCFHSRYNLGDKNTGYSKEDYDSWKELADQLKEDGAGTILPLYLYDHSGITMSTGSFDCKWDSGQVGFIFVSQKDIDECEWSQEWKDEHHKSKTNNEVAEVFLKGEIETYDNFITGSVYGFTIEETDDSCWGFYGYEHEESGLLDHARNSIDCTINNRVKERLAKLKEYIKAGVPMIYRKLPEIV